jgi:hypothetical protein
MSIKGSGRGGIMTEIGLNNSQINPLFEEMGGIRVSESVHGSVLADTALF